MLEDGRFKIWNVGSGEEILSFKWPCVCTSCVLDSKQNKLYCFFANNNEIRIIDLNKFSQELYMANKDVPSEKKAGV